MRYAPCIQGKGGAPDAGKLSHIFAGDTRLSRKASDPGLSQRTAIGDIAFGTKEIELCMR